LLDEPTAFIDRDGTVLVEELLAREAETGGRTIIMSTHSREQAVRLGGRMLFVREGRVLRLEPEVGTDEEEYAPEGMPEVRVRSGTIDWHRNH
jgi:ABC-type cobalamin/Fe3+-siderophores transport system ATPase subunit